MEIDGEPKTNTNKRKAVNPDDKEEQEMAAEDSRLVNYFGEFRVPTIFWGVYKEVENMGLLYLHRGTNKPLMIVRRADAANNVMGYNLYCQADEEKEAGLVGFIKLDMSLMGFTEEDRQYSVCHAMDQIAEQYIKEGSLTDTEEAVRNCDEFITLLGLERLVDRTTEAIKKRRGCC